MTEVTVRRPPSTALVLRSLLRADATVLLRSGRSVLLTFVLPIAILFLTAAGSRNQGARVLGGPGFLIGLSITYGLMTAGMLGYPIQVARDRESGVFQRMRVTPAPTWTIPVSRLVVQLVMLLVMTLVVMVLGGVRHHVSYGPGQWLGVLGVSVLGAVVFLAIGQAIVGLAPTSGEVNAVGRVLLVVLIFVGLVGSTGLLGDTIRGIAVWTPMGALAELYSVATGGVAWGADQTRGLVACVVYVAAGTYVGIRWFRWTVRQ